MNRLLSLFRRRPAPSEAARALSDMAHLNYRERVRARARLMREQLGLPPAPELDSRK